MTEELRSSQQSSELSYRDRLEDAVVQFKEQVDLVKDTADIKKKLELLANGFFIIAGIETLIGAKRIESMVVHGVNSGKLSQEAITCLQDLRQELLSSGRH